jgi:hypothetical protein
MKQKCLLICGQEATQMFSQQNNFYCDLLSETKIQKDVLKKDRK